MVFDDHGQLHAQAFCNIDTHRQGNQVEHDPEQLVESLRSAAQDAVKQLDRDADCLVAAGLATQRSSILCWERDTGTPLSSVLSWQDTRAGEWLSSFNQYEDRIHSITGLVLSPHYGVSKLRWCLDHLPRVRQARQHGDLVFGPLASFLACRLSDTSPLLADPANASRTLLCDRDSGDWSDELLDRFGIPRECLPEMVSSRHDWGEVSLGHLSLPITVVTGDQSAALFAFGNPDPDTVYANLGTGAFLQQTSGDSTPDPGRLLASVVYQDQQTSTRVIEATVNGAGSAINKLADELDIDRNMLKTNADGWLHSLDAELVYINAVSGLGSPWWMADVASRFDGPDGASASDADRIAAVFESIAFLITVNLETMAKVLDKPERLLVTGGLASVDPLLQRLANLAGLAVERAESREATARGLAFLLAGLPDRWPGARISHSFVPTDNPGLSQRYRYWRSLMEKL